MSDLSDFFKEKKEEYEQSQVDWDKVRDEWIHQINEFMYKIKDWLLETQKAGIIDIAEKKIEITEEYLGKYKVPSLDINIGTEYIKITPVGRLIIGAKGRVDISSFINRFIVLYHSEKGWIYRNEGQRGSFQPLTEDNFTKILKELV